MQPPVSLHSHRLDNNASKLPSFRHADLNLNANQSDAPGSGAGSGTGPLPGLALLWPSETTPYSPSDLEQKIVDCNVIYKKDHARNYSESAVQVSLKKDESSVQAKQRPVTSTGPVESRIIASNTPDASTTTQAILTKEKAKKDPARDSRGRYPPLAMLNGSQKYFQASTIKTENNNPTEDWVAEQSVLTTSPLDDRKSQPLESPLSQPVTPSIPPIRGFKSSRKSVDALSPRAAMDQDDTVRGLDGYNSRRPLNREQEEQSSDDSDLFLKLAREESAANSRSGIVRRVSIAS